MQIAGLNRARKQETDWRPLHLTSGRLLAGNILWNLIGACSPAVVAVFCLPALKNRLGTERLGVITLAWVVVGYFGLFDFGLARALTKLVAQRVGEQRFAEVPSLIRTALLLLLGFGLLGGLVIFLAAPWFVRGPLKIISSLQNETLYAFYWLSVSIPMVTVTAGLRGVLEAFQKFRLATAIRIPMGIFNYLGPLLVVPFSHSLVTVIATLVLGRLIAALVHLWACLAVLPELRQRLQVRSSSLGAIIRFGSWMTVSNVVAPFMITFDRFVIGAMISVSAVAYYAVPSEMAFRLGIGPAALVGVLFPAFSTAAGMDTKRLVVLYDRGIMAVLLGLFPLTLVLIAFAPEILRLWLGSDFAMNSTSVTRYLTAAMFANGIAQVPFAHIQSAGRPDITAKIHLLELPVYAVALFSMARAMGIQGVAIAWLLRILLDTALLLWCSHRLLPGNRPGWPRLLLMVPAAVITLLLAALDASLAVKIAFVCGTCAAAAVAVWLWVLSPHERNLLRSGFPRTPIDSASDLASGPARNSVYDEG